MTFDPLVPRPIDLPTPVPLDGSLETLDGAKILAAPSDPAEWPAWREALARWREDARARTAYDDSAYDRLEWTQACFSVALLWLWDELLYDFESGRFTPERFCAESEREFGGFDEVREALARGARVRTVHGSHAGFAVLDRLSLWQAQISLGLARDTSHRHGLA